VTGILKAKNVTGVTVPASQIVTSPDIVSASSLAILYQRIRAPSQGGATGVHYDNALVGTSAVESGQAHPLSTSSETTVFASTTSLVIDVVVEDSSDAPEVQVPVTLTVRAGTQSLTTQTRKIPEIPAHGQATVSFSNIQVPVSALSHSASISVNIKKVRGEARLDNNAATYPVFFRLARG